MPTQSSYKAVRAHCTIGWGGGAVTGGWKSARAFWGCDVPSGRVVGGALGGEGGAPLPSSKALAEGVSQSRE